MTRRVFVDAARRLHTHYIPLEMREILYKEVRRLARKGFGSRRIQKILVEKYSKKMPAILHLSRTTIRDWMRGRHKPWGNTTKIKLSYPELQYVIGAILSDGAFYILTYKTRSNMYRFDFRVRDYEFAAEVAKSLRKLGIAVKIGTRIQNNRLYYSIQFSNYRLFKILKNERSWKRYVKENPSGFLRGYFDGDGGALLPYFVSTDRKMLEYIRKILLKYFDIRCSKIIKFNAKESEIDGRKIKGGQAYMFNIHPFDYKKFYDIVKPSIARKDHLLRLSIKVAEEKHFQKRIEEAGDRWSEVVNDIRNGIAKVLRRKKRQILSPEIYSK